MKIIITGGAGFIGSNAASRYLRNGDHVLVVDNLSRKGSKENLSWLRPQGNLEFVDLDIRESSRVVSLFKLHDDADRVLHLAAQVAVTTSVIDPRFDFENNALGTLNVLEAVREAQISSPIIYSSTNKVYGEMPDLRIVERNGRYEYESLNEGVSEDRALDFHSPYGCSKGAADQYMIDYYRIYGLRTIVFRQSCVYGYRQFGVEDQGWVAWFTIASQLGLPLSLYGDGKQVRDILFVEDLLDAYDAAFSEADRIAGRAYNIGGGPQNAVSVMQVVNSLEQRQREKLILRYADWRPGDQKVFVSNIRRARNDFGWAPRVSYEEGLELLYRWASENKNLFADRLVAQV